MTGLFQHAWIAVLRQAFLFIAAALLSGFAQGQAPAAWQQKVYVHVNKTFFVGGELLWFSVYNVDATAQVPTDLEKLAFIELFNDKQQPVLQTTVALQGGRGWGALMMGDTMQTGNYLLRAYTNAMRNSGPTAFFETPITVVNTAQQPAWKDLEKLPMIDVQIFPEGGTLVYGLANNTAIRCINEWGEGIAATGAIVNQLKDTVARFTTCCGGRALFTWTPKKEEQYNIVVQPKASAKHIVPVPEPLTDGVAMRIKKAGAEKLEVTVQGSGMYQNNNLLLIAGSEHKLQLRRGSDDITLSEEDLPQGLSNLLLYDAAGTLLANQWWYRQPQDSLLINVKILQNAYGHRQEVKVDLHAATGSGAAVAADLSVSVFRIDSLQQIGFSGMPYFGSELPEAFREAPDLFVRTTGTPWMDGKHGADGAVAVYMPQYEGPQVLAMITDKQTTKPAAGIRAHLSLPGKAFQFATAVSDTAGIVRFNLNGFTERQKALLTLAPERGGYAIKGLSYFEPKPPVRNTPRFALPEKWVAQLEEHYLSQQVQTAFGTLPAVPVINDIAADTSTFFGQADKTYFLDAYTRFPTLEEVLREYVPEVAVRKRDAAFHYRVLNVPYGQFFDEDPLVLLDGVPQFDIDGLMAADPLKIRKLEVVTRRYAKGLDVYPGIMSFTTYGANRDGVPLPGGAQALNIAGNLSPQAFRQVQHSGLTEAGNRIPDRRLQLCWLPALQTGADGKQNFSFFTSDVAGTYAIVVHGITKGGIAGSAVVFFEVGK